MMRCPKCGFTEPLLRQRGAPAPEKPEPVQWPFTQTSSLTVKRGFVALMLQLKRKHDGRVAGYKLRAHYLAANGRPFNWPVRGATAKQVSAATPAGNAEKEAGSNEMA